MRRRLAAAAINGKIACHTRRTMMRVALLAFAALAVAMPARAEEAYRDDRSGPAALIDSLYNAINRKEYARAWSYFAEPPAATLEKYAKGYERTERVRVRTGTASEEGAAGSTYYNLPVAIAAYETNGDVAVFAGCYEMRLADPLIQGEDFRPLHIVKGKLAPSSEALEDAVPASCGDGPAPDPAAITLARAKQMYRAAYAAACTAMDGPEPAGPEPQQHELTFNYSYDGENDPKRTGRLYGFACNRGAYNESRVYFFADERGEPRPVGFAMPELDIRYATNDDQSKVEAVYVTGFQSAFELTNSEFDSKTMTLTSFAKWRGVGDASAAGTWIFRNGDFALVKYDVDASYDGKIDPETVIDYQTGP